MRILSMALAKNPLGDDRRLAEFCAPMVRASLRPDAIWKLLGWPVEAGRVLRICWVVSQPENIVTHRAPARNMCFMYLLN